MKIRVDSVEYKCWHEVDHVTIFLHPKRRRDRLNPCGMDLRLLKMQENSALVAAREPAAIQQKDFDLPNGPIELN